MTNLLNWLKVNGASILGIIQAVIKCLKEVLTSVLNLLSILHATAAQTVVTKIRDFLNIIDGYLENIKTNLLPKL